MAAAGRSLLTAYDGGKPGALRQARASLQSYISSLSPEEAEEFQQQVFVVLILIGAFLFARTILCCYSKRRELLH